MTTPLPPLLYSGQHGGQVPIRERKHTIGRARNLPYEGRIDIDVRLEYADGIVGVAFSGAIWLPSMRDISSGGQCQDRIKDLADQGAIDYAEGWNRTRLDLTLALWDRLHLNTMRPNCEHQADLPTRELIDVTPFTWSPKFYKLRQQAERGELSVEDYAAYRLTAKVVDAACFGWDAPKDIALLPQAARDLLADGLLQIEKHERKPRGSVSFREHTLGLLSRPCETCGYRYGNAHVLHPLTDDDRRMLYTVLDVAPPADRRVA